MNYHERQILSWSVIPAPLSDSVTRDAQAIGRDIAEQLKLEGILAVELFLVRDGSLLINELAPRPHNSFHETEVACSTSQFEQLVRAICDLPLGDTAVRTLWHCRAGQLEDALAQRQREPRPSRVR